MDGEPCSGSGREGEAAGAAAMPEVARRDGQTCEGHSAGEGGFEATEQGEGASAAAEAATASLRAKAVCPVGQVPQVGCAGANGPVSWRSAAFAGGARRREHSRGRQVGNRAGPKFEGRARPDATTEREGSDAMCPEASAAAAEAAAADAATEGALARRADAAALESAGSGLLAGTATGGAGADASDGRPIEVESATVVEASGERVAATVAKGAQALDTAGGGLAAGSATGDAEAAACDGKAIERGAERGSTAVRELAAAGDGARPLDAAAGGPEAGSATGAGRLAPRGPFLQYQGVPPPDGAARASGANVAHDVGYKRQRKLQGHEGLIHGPASGLEVRARGLLARPSDVRALIGAIEAAAARGRAGGAARPDFRDFDISENFCGVNEFKPLFEVLRRVKARVRRFRLFGMPLLNDDVAGLMARYLRECTAEEAPREIHLSDCSLGSKGLVAIFGAAAEGVGFRGAPPLYVRLERNFVEPRVLQGYLDSGFAALVSGAGQAAALCPTTARVCLKAFGGARCSRSVGAAAPADASKATDQSEQRSGAAGQVWRPKGLQRR